MDTVRERAPKTKLDFVPVIFANDKDDDLPGLIAALRNERVQLDDKIIEEGEDVILHQRTLRLSKSLHIYDKETIVFGDAEDDEVVLVVDIPIGRFVSITWCSIFTGKYSGPKWYERGWE